MIYLPSNYSEDGMIERLAVSLHMEALKLVKDYEYAWRMYQIYEDGLS